MRLLTGDRTGRSMAKMSLAQNAGVPRFTLIFSMFSRQRRGKLLGSRFRLRRVHTFALTQRQRKERRQGGGDGGLPPSLLLPSLRMGLISSLPLPTPLCRLTTGLSGSSRWGLSEGGRAAAPPRHRHIHTRTHAHRAPLSPATQYQAACGTSELPALSAGWFS